MSEDHIILEQIDLYLDGTLSGTELQNFEKLINSDAAIAQQVELAKVAKQVIIDFESSQLSDQISSDLQKIKAPNNKGKWIFGGGILLLLIGTVFWATLPTSNKPSPKTTTAILQESVQSPSTNVEQKSESPSTLTIAELNTASPTTSESKQKNVSSVPIEGNIAKDLETKVEAISSKDETPAEESHLKPIPEKSDNVDHTAKAEVVQKTTILEPIRFSVSSTPTYLDEPSGSITINIDRSNVDNTDYLFSIDNGESYQKFNRFQFLDQGEYLVIVKDENEQLSDAQTVIITSLPCNKNYDKTFSPDAGMTWMAPAQPESEGVFILQNQQGMAVFEQSFEAYDRIEWDGISNKNQQITSGYYRFTIKYESGETCYGDLTILR